MLTRSQPDGQVPIGLPGLAHVVDAWQEEQGI